MRKLKMHASLSRIFKLGWLLAKPGTTIYRCPMPSTTVGQSKVRFENSCWLTWILTHWGRATHICVSKLTIIGSDNGLSPDRRQAIIWTNDGILLIRPLGTNFSEISIEILTFSFKKMRMKVSSAKWRPFCLGLNVWKFQAAAWAN